MLNFMALYWPQCWKKDYHKIWEANLQPLGANVSASIHVLMSMFYHLLLVTWGGTISQKMLKVGPKFFQP
jgi:hypothetical protein